VNLVGVGELHAAFPDFLLVLLALAGSMRLSLMKAAHAAPSSAARQEIRVLNESRTHGRAQRRVREIRVARGGSGLAFFAVILLGPGLRRVAAIVGHLAAVADG
jgi:hypothetical protein